MTENKTTASTPSPGLWGSGTAGLWAFLVRWQEHTGWMPLCVALAVLAWIVFGALDRAAVLDALPLLVLLPIKLAYAIAAGGVMFLVRRRWRMKLSKTEQADLYKLLLAGDRGALTIYLTDAVLTLCTFLALLAFFYLPA